MAIEDILRALEEQAKTDIDAVLHEAREHATLIETQATAEASAIHDGFVKQVERNATSKASKLVNAARLEAKMTVSSARGDGLEDVFKLAQQQLGKLRDRAGYDAVFQALLKEALEGLTGDVIVHVDPADEARANGAASTSGTVTVVADLTTAAGVVVEANGGRVIRRNTAEDRLERARQQVQAEVAKVLFA